MIDQKLVREFAILLGYLKIAISLKSFNYVKNDYEKAISELLSWLNYYYENKNLNIINYSNSLRMHELLEDIRNDVIFDKNMGIESEIGDYILIRYEVIVKMINDERKSAC